MKTIASTTHNMKIQGGWNELFGVILDQTFIFFGNTFLKSGKLVAPKMISFPFLFACWKFIKILIDIVRLYKENYDLFREKYIKNANNGFYELDKYFGNI